MKIILNALVIGLAGSLSLGRLSALAHLEVSAGVEIHATTEFYGPLSTHGVWIEVAPYGHCWRPAHVAVGWRPYCHGHWVWTDCGWYWASDEPWAWACYHYGGWVYDPFHGWIWVPGIEWAPAWVHWRVGGGYCGWAPLPPHGVVVAPASFVFVEARHFHEPVRPSKVIVNNTTIINQTTLVGNPRHETRQFAGLGPRKVVVNDGLGLDHVQRATGKKLSPAPIQEVARKTPAPPEVQQVARERKLAPAPRPEIKPRHRPSRHRLSRSNRPGASLGPERERSCPRRLIHKCRPNHRPARLRPGAKAKGKAKASRTNRKEAAVSQGPDIGR
jgi:hypothetical protein